MSGIFVRLAVSARGNILLAALIVGAVLFGTLAMHSIITSPAAPTIMITSGAGPVAPSTASTAASAHDTSAMSAATDASAAGIARSASPGTGPLCLNDCTTDLLMAGLLCAIAILVLMLVLLVSGAAQRSWVIELRHRVMSAIPAPARVLQPPSLLLLSISRI